MVRLVPGQMGVFGPVEGFRRGIRLCIDLGYSDDDIRRMTSLNAARAIAIEFDETEIA